MYNLQANTGNKRPLRIMTKIANKDVVTLYDTGAAVSLLNKEFFFKNLFVQGAKQVKKYEGPLPVSASNQEIPITECADLNVRIANTEQEITFLLAPKLSEQCLLGLDAIDKFDCWLYCGRARCLYYQGQKIPLVNKEGLNEAEYDAVYACDVVVPPGAQVTVEVNLLPIGKETVPSSELVFIEPDDEYLKAKGLYSQGSVVLSSGKQLVELLNFTEQQISLEKGQLYGIAEPLDIVDKLEREINLEQLEVNYINSQITFRDRMEFLRQNLNLSKTATTCDEREKLRALIFEFADIFSTGDGDIGRTNMIEHVIETYPGTKPVAQRPYRAELQSPIIEREVNKMLAQGLSFLHMVLLTTPPLTYQGTERLSGKVGIKKKKRISGFVQSF